MTIQSQLDTVLALAEKATPDWRARAHGVVVGGEFNEYANGKAQSQVASFNVMSNRDNAIGEQVANTELAVAAVNFIREHGPAIRAAVGGVGETVAWWREDHVCHAHELTAANALADGYKPCVIKCEDCAWNASLCDTHGAVGGEAVAAAWTTREQLKLLDNRRTKRASMWSARNKERGDIPLYIRRKDAADASPPATVDVGATGPTCEAWAIVRPDGKTIHPESVRGSEHAAQWGIGEWPAMQKQGFTCRRITIIADELNKELSP